MPRMASFVQCPNLRSNNHVSQGLNICREDYKVRVSSRDKLKSNLSLVSSFIGGKKGVVLLFGIAYYSQDFRPSRNKGHACEVDHKA